ncbi:MAG: flagellar motor stator protein MotA [Rhodospirillaceae bacterium]|nr:flagellar motor stator protein MotA [Rhodospirillaceae bacterium]MBT5667498.1 flagellar motor stator protein MotA [Rhodospirillaceae bacterium]MBT5810946.1 flagellar motor stator protein MotA [Rhodospirillaceae bacterium]
MFPIIGLVGVTAAVLVSFVLMGGHLNVLWQPLEFVIIGGSGIFAFMIANPKEVVLKTGGGIGAIFKGPKYKKADYLELLTMQYQVFRMAKTKGMLSLEQHVDNPHDSAIFQSFPAFHGDHHATEFFCDYLRLMTLGTDNPNEIETIIDIELDTHHHEADHVAHAINTLAESFPGLGIVAAVLGVIHTMGSIQEPPEILGGLIAAALVGTFLGILLCYGFVGPMAAALKSVREEEHLYFVCLKSGILAHLQGYAPAVTVEFARKCLMSHIRPTFMEVEEACAELPPV